MKNIVSTLILTAALAFLAAACAPATEKAAPEKKEAAPAAKEKPQYGGVLRQTTANPRIGMDPHRTTGSAHFFNFGRAYSSLLRFKIEPDVPESQLIIAPDLAERWENPTPTTWVFHLSKGVKWHNIPPVNAREFVADDVVYSVNRLAGPGSAQKGYWQDLEKVEALDRYTVKFTLKNPVAPFLTIVAFGFNKMVAKEAVEAGGGNLDNGPLIGTGAWLVTCTVDVECVFKRNPDYFLKDEDGQQFPYLDQVQMVVIPDTTTRLTAFRAKQLDGGWLYDSVSADEKPTIERAHPEVIFKLVKTFQINMIHFRNDRVPWNDERVRMAVSKAIDRQQVIDATQGGLGWFQFGWVSPEDWYVPQEEFQQAYKRDVISAKKLLLEAGYPNGIDASLWCPQTQLPPCELMVPQMAEAGIRAKINPHEYTIYLSRVFKRDGEFEDMAFGPQGAFMDPDLWLSAYYHSQGGRNSGYVKDPKLDSMIEAQRREMDPEKRKTLIHEIQRYLLQKNYQLAIAAARSWRVRWPWLKNVSYSASDDYPAGRHLEYFWIDQELAKKLGRRE